MLSLFRGPLTDDARSSLLGSGIEEDGDDAIETDRVNDAPFNATRSATLGLVVVDTVRLGASVGAGGMGKVGSAGAARMGERPPTGLGEGGKLWRNTDPDRRRVVGREGVTVDGGRTGGADVYFTSVPLGVETTPLENTLR
jgi:hypothetical protein